MLGYLRDDLWLETAQEANAKAAVLEAGLRDVPGAEMVFGRDVNMIFARLPRATHQRLKAAGAVYGLYEGPLESGAADQPLMARFVCDWSVTEQQIARFLEIARG
jgi:threonine aldolase